MSVVMVSVFILSAFTLSFIILSVLIISNFALRVVMLVVQGHCAYCHYTECD